MGREAHEAPQSSHRPAPPPHRLVVPDRNAVERCFSKLKQNRAIATRYDKR